MKLLTRQREEQATEIHTFLKKKLKGGPTGIKRFLYYNNRDLEKKNDFNWALGEEREDRFGWRKTKGQNCHLICLGHLLQQIILEIRLMTDLILSSDVAAWLEIRTKTADDRYLQQRRENVLFCVYQQRVCQVSRAKCSVSSQSDRFPFIISNQASSPAKLNIFIDSTIFLCQLHTVRKGTKWRKKGTFMNPQSLTPLHLGSPPPRSSCVSDFSRVSSSFTLALLQQLSGWFHSDATPTPHIAFFVIGSRFLSKSKTLSLTSTPTHLQNRFELQLCSDFSLALSTLFPRWLVSHIGANTGSAPIWWWVDFGRLHFESKPAVHQLWLSLTLLCSWTSDSSLFSAQSEMPARLYFLPKVLPA